MLRSQLSRRFRACSIEPASLRDCTYVACNMRDRDREEVMCQMPPGSSLSDAGHVAFASSPRHKFTVFLDGEPEVSFGCSPVTFAGNVQALWMFGTDRSRLTIPYVTLFFFDHIIPDLVEMGATRVEVRALESNLDTIRWLTKVGLRDGGLLPRFGTGGEKFHLLYTTDELWPRTKTWMPKRVRPLAEVNGVMAGGGDLHYDQ